MPTIGRISPTLPLAARGLVRRWTEVSAEFRLLRHWRERRIGTQLTAAERLLLFDLARGVRSGCCLEVGSYLGASATFMAAGLRAAGSKATVYCVDTWTNIAMSEGKRDTFDEFRKNTERYGERILPLRGESKQVALAFQERIDLLFLDGDHSYSGVSADVEAWFPKLAPSAIVAFHDVGWAEGVQAVVDERVRPRAVTEGRLPNLYWARLR